jgi:hypothetical protein
LNEPSEPSVANVPYLGWKAIQLTAQMSEVALSRWHLNAKFFDAIAGSTCCTATRPSTEPRQKPDLSGKFATHRLWYLSGDSISRKGVCGFCRLKMRTLRSAVPTVMSGYCTRARASIVVSRRPLGAVGTRGRLRCIQREAARARPLTVASMQ